jgi:hypothetical protein
MILRVGYQESDSANDPYWDSMRNQDYSRSFPAVKEFIHQNSQKMKRPNKRRNFITWALAVLLPLLIVFSCKRETFVEPQNATLSFLAKDSSQSSVEFLIQQYADKQWKVVMRSHAGTIHGTIHAPTETYDKLKTFSEKLKSLPGVNEFFLSSFSTTVEESRLSRLSYKIFNRHFDAKSASVEKLRAELEAKLKEVGLNDLKLKLTKADGRMQLNTEPTGTGYEFSVDLTLSDGTNVTAIGEKW